MPLRSIDSIEPVTLPEAITPPSSLSPPGREPDLARAPASRARSGHSARTVAVVCRRPDIRPARVPWAPMRTLSGRSRASRAQSALSERVSNQREPERSRGWRAGPGRLPPTVRPSTEAVTSSMNTESPAPRRGGKRKPPRRRLPRANPALKRSSSRARSSETNSR